LTSASLAESTQPRAVVIVSDRACGECSSEKTVTIGARVYFYFRPGFPNRKDVICGPVPRMRYSSRFSSGTSTAVCIVRSSGTKRRII